MREQEVLNMSAYAGEILLTNGAEIARVEDTVLRLLAAFNIHKASVYVVSNALFITISVQDGHDVTAVRNLPLSDVHLGRIDAVNSLARELTQTPTENIADVMERLKQCESLPESNKALQLAAGGIAGATFCVLSGGVWQDAVCALCIGVMLQVYQLYQKKARFPFFISSIFSSLLVTTLAVFVVNMNFGSSLPNIITGSITSLLPGIAITTSARNFFSGDYLSGYIHLIHALLKAACLATGVVLALQFWGYVMSGVSGL